ncbi:MAG: methyltransferase domain-containing protein [Candidatus Aminicenantales bacterium]
MMRKALIKEHRVEKRLGIDTVGNYRPLTDISRNKDMKPYGPTSYDVLEEMRDYLKLTIRDVFVDFGAGKGRVVCFLAGERVKKVVGVELEPVMLAAARKNIDRLKIKNSAVELMEIDAAVYDLSEGTVFFFYYPFEHKTFNQIIRNIKKSLANRPRSVRLVYVGCQQRERWILDMQKDWLAKEYDGNFLVYRSTVSAQS